MKTYTKTVIAVVILVGVATFGFGTAFGYGGSVSGSRRQTVTFAPAAGKVLGAETTNWNNLPAAEKAAIIKGLQATLAEILKTMQALIASGELK